MVVSLIFWAVGLGSAILNAVLITMEKSDFVYIIPTYSNFLQDPDNKGLPESMGCKLCKAKSSLWPLSTSSCSGSEFPLVSQERRNHHLPLGEVL